MMRILVAIFATALVGLLWAVVAAAHHVRQARRRNAEQAQMQVVVPVVPDAPLLPSPVARASGRQPRPLETFF